MAISIYCPHCRKHTSLNIAPAKYKTEYGDTVHTGAVWEADYNQSWWIGVCNACKMPSLVLNNGAIIFPSPLPSPTDSNIPKDLALDLDEAKMCFSTKCYRACAVMARRCIQAACIKKGATAKDLVGQIKELTHAGIITKDIEVHFPRILGHSVRLGYHRFQLQ